MTRRPAMRLNVNLSPRSAEDIKALSARKQISLTVAIQEAILTYKFLLDEANAGRIIQTSDADRNRIREIRV